MSNIQRVLTIYEAFGRGDVPTILSHLADDVEWEHGAADVGIPWLKPRQGRAEVPAFFEAMGALEIRSFQPKTLLERDNVVVAIIGLEFVVKATAHTVKEDDEVHIWRFGDDGKVASFCHKVDTHQHWLALQPT
ncbi:nuclear transport factor 2 family protein [uncultured Methylibium sp.]|uniref:nuclear transport factor 2 family protein n=1 Tax=uncultured Methylibium sp. TaxID=381093 RepID=UPI0025F5E357|nr:nuclear transport factor 2 family protein [uncultured Methylibium sp.]